MKLDKRSLLDTKNSKGKRLNGFLQNQNKKRQNNKYNNAVSLASHAPGEQEGQRTHPLTWKLISGTLAKNVSKYFSSIKKVNRLPMGTNSVNTAPYFERGVRCFVVSLGWCLTIRGNTNGKKN